jgi:hypothetical protein
MASDNEGGEVDYIQFEEVDLEEEASEKTVRYFLCTEHIDCEVKVKVETNTHSPIVHVFMTNNTHAQEISQRAILPYVCEHVNLFVGAQLPPSVMHIRLRDE